MKRALAAGLAFAAAAGSGVLASLVATSSSTGLWVALAVVVILGAVLQGVVTASERKASGKIPGAGAVVIGGSAGRISTRVRGASVIPGDGDRDGFTGPGSVSVGGDAKGPVSTDVSGEADAAKS